MTAKLPKRGQKCKKKYATTNFSWLLIPPLLIRADFVFLHFVFLSFITETVSLKGESQSIIIWLNLISHHHLDEMDFLCNECAKRFAKKVNLVIHQARVHNKRSFSCEMCHVKFWMKILISQKLRKTLLWSRIWNSSISCAAFNRPAVFTAVLIALGTKWTSVESRQTKRELGWGGKGELVKVYLIAMRLSSSQDQREKIWKTFTQ